MITFKQFISEEVDHNQIRKDLHAHGFSTGNVGGSVGWGGNRHNHAYAKSHNVNGDDHRYKVLVDHSAQKPKFVAKHSVSRGYWSHKWDHPDIHKDVDVKEFRSHKAAISHLNKIHKANEKLKKKK